MPSITTWNRLEPRPSTPDISATLAARLRDPLWMLTRQWQMGEFQGEDAGSPAFVTLSSSVARVASWAVGNSPFRALTGGPVDAALGREELDGSDDSLAIELGHTLRAMLEGVSATAAIAAFETAFPLTAADSPSEEQLRLLAACSGRLIDGVTVFHEAKRNPGTIPRADVASGDQPAVVSALNGFVSYVQYLYGDLSGGDPPAWNSEGLRYDARVATTPGDAVLSATPASDGALEWYSFDLVSGSVETSEASVAAVMPGHARFRGMPNERFWDFEDANVDFGDVRPDRRDLSRLVLIEFMLIAANDWFVIPIVQYVGSFQRIDSLTVSDVFGVQTPVRRAGSADPTDGGRWSMFATAGPDRDAEYVDGIFLPPVAAGALQRGDAVEEVHFVRDETANMLWAVEHAVPNGVGGSRQAQEAAQADRPAVSPTRASGEQQGPTLRYRIQTDVPRNWIPFLPVLIDAASGQIALELGEMLDANGHSVPPAPFGRLLSVPPLAGRPYGIREEEVPRSGLRVSRLPYVSRWTDGSAYLWWGRWRRTGVNQTASGLSFDVVQSA
jgi:hypothetical protein